MRVGVFGTRAGKIPSYVECTIHILRCIAAGHDMRGKNGLPSAEIHPIAVTQLDNRLSEEHISIPDANPAT